MIEPVWVFVDAFLAIVEKPAGFLSVPGKHLQQPDLSAWVQKRFPFAKAVHRLDQATSGLVLFALHAKTHAVLSTAFAKGLIEKHYIADVDGFISEDSGEIHLPILSTPSSLKRTIDAKGKPATTRWQVIQHHKESTRLQLTPITGRTHQLRIHLAAIGHAIMGDTLYHPMGQHHLIEPMHPSEEQVHPRLHLHASTLKFHHPHHPTWLHFTSLPSF